MPIEKETEERIYAAARQIFHEKGFDGARMQEIADRAGINKALLHYYFRNKDQLFEKVFQAAIAEVFPKVLSSLTAEAPLRERVEKFVAAYIDTLKANPFVPGFVLHELSKNPERVQTFIPSLVKPVLQTLTKDIQAAMADGGLPVMDPKQFLLNVMSLCIFPFVAKPLLQSIFGLDETAYNLFLEERKTVIPELVFSGSSAAPL